LIFQGKKEKELEKQMDEVFNHYRPMVPQEKEWRVKTNSHTEPDIPVAIVRHTSDLETPTHFLS
jgi:hypothetical protein